MGRIASKLKPFSINGRHMMHSKTTNVLQLFQEPQPVNKDSIKSVKSERFDELWKLWPRKDGKVLAKSRYEAILGGCRTRTLEKDSGSFISIELEATEDQIISAAKKYLASQVDKNTYKMKDDGKFIPHLNTWLNRGLFLDFE